MTLARKISLGCCVVVFLVLSVTAMAQSSASGAALGRHLGVPAIMPHGLQQTGATFTAADVTQWINSNQIGVQPAGAARPQVISVDFITAAQASQRMGGESVGVPDSSLVCFAQVRGDFITYGPPSGKHMQGEVATLHDHDYTLVFDAQTGNILVEGG
ncbi:MAG TPA: hypothetical protein VF120_01820 [Ktedonobacterales bacterium]